MVLARRHIFKPQNVVHYFNANSKTMIIKKTLITIFLILINFSGYCQDKTYQDFINDITPTFPGCENSKDKSECYSLEVGNLILSNFNKPDNLDKLNDVDGVLEIKLTLRNEINGKTTILKVENVNDVVKNLVIESLEKLPLIQPITSFRDGESKVSSTSFYIIIEKKNKSNYFEQVIRKSKQDYSKMPSPNPDKIKHVLLENCKNDDRSSDCFYLTIKQYIIDKLDKNTIDEIRGEKFYLKIKFDKNGKIDTNAFKCSLNDKKEIFLKLIETIKVKKAAELNNEKIDMTYSIPIQIE